MNAIQSKKNLTWNLKLKRLIPKFSFSTPNVDPIKFMINFGIIMFIAFLIFGARVSYTMAEAYIAQQKKLDIRIEEQLTPLIAKIEQLEDQVKYLDSHAQVKYYKYKTKRYKAYKNGKFVGYKSVTKQR